MPKLIDLTGKKFSRLKIIKRALSKKGKTRWVAICDCGVEKIVNGESITHPDPKKRTYSCGCRGIENRTKLFTTHGLCGNHRYRMYSTAKARAKNRGIEFSIVPKDIPEIPEKCPYLKIPLFKGVGLKSKNSPSLDRINSSLGYIPGNIQIISDKANSMKHTSTFEEFECMYLNWKNKIHD